MTRKDEALYVLQHTKEWLSASEIMQKCNIESSMSVTNVLSKLSKEGIVEKRIRDNRGRYGLYEYRLKGINHDHD